MDDGDSNPKVDSYYGLQTHAYALPYPVHDVFATHRPLNLCFIEIQLSFLLFFSSISLCKYKVIPFNLPLVFTNGDAALIFNGGVRVSALLITSFILLENLVSLSNSFLSINRILFLP